MKNACKKLEKAIEAVTDKATNAESCDEALKFKQAAQNAAHAITVLKNLNN